MIGIKVKLQNYEHYHKPGEGATAEFEISENGDLIIQDYYVNSFTSALINRKAYPRGSWVEVERIELGDD